MSIFNHQFKSLTVLSGQRTLEYVDGAFIRVLEPGRYRMRRRADYVPVFTRDQLAPTAPQEVLTADGVTVKLSAVVRWRVADARRYVEIANDPFAHVYLAIQIALREAIAQVDAESALALARSSLGRTLTEVARPVGVEVGIDVAEVVVRDVLPPAELRAASAELVSARQRGLAQLEAARAETAALRSLANGAKLLDEHPALAQLRLVQALPHGSTVKLSTSEPRT